MPRKTVNPPATAIPFADVDTNDPAETPGVMPPPGVSAQVETKIKYNTQVDPERMRAERDRDNGYDPRDSRRYTDINDLALEADADLAPPDPLSAFCETWANYAGYNCGVVRLPDPPHKRMPGNQYARPHFGEVERLGSFPFDPQSLDSSVQYFNGNSGGVFRIWLTDHAGQPIPGARLDRLALADPPGAGANASRFGVNRERERGDLIGGSPAPAPLPVKSALEERMEQIQAQLFERALMNTLNPTPPPPPTPPALSEEQQLATVLLTKTDMLGNVVTKLAEAMNSAEAKREETWKEKAIDFVKDNPQVAVNLTNAAQNILTGVTNLLGDLVGNRRPAPARPAVQHPPQATPAAAQANPAPAPVETVIDAEDTETEDDQDMAILEDVVTLLNSADPLTLEHPIITELKATYPLRFKFWETVLTAAPEDTIIAQIAAISPLYNSLLTGPATGPHLRARLTELKTLLANQPKGEPE